MRYPNVLLVAVHCGVLRHQSVEFDPLNADMTNVFGLRDTNVTPSFASVVALVASCSVSPASVIATIPFRKCRRTSFTFPY